MSGSGKGSGGSSKNVFTVLKLLEIEDIIDDAFSLADSARTDYKESTTRNTTTTVTGIGAGMAGGSAGSKVGEAIGSIAGPTGAQVGRVLGGFIGGYVSEKAATGNFNAVADEAQYNMAIRSCDTCHTRFLARVYRGETKCEKCRGGH